ncbi:MAG TPA: tripartite tricarboxylate transporter substrate binding protein [Eoetvoesiella sp.]
MRQVLTAVMRGLLVAAVMATATAQAQNFPSRDITFIVPFNPGGSTDPLGRAFAAQLEKALPGNINVENRAGGSATIGTNLVVRAKADGYTMGLGDSAALAYQPLVNSNLAYKSPDDYQPLVKLADVPALLLVRPDAPWKNFEEFLADAKNKPGKIRVAVSGVRSISDLVIQQLNRSADVKLATVPFTGGGGEVLLSVMGGRVEAGIGYGGNPIAQAQAGKLKVLAVFAKGTYPLAPEATSVPDAGYNATLPASYSVIAPKGMPEDLLNKLVAASQKAVQTSEFQAFAQKNGYIIDSKNPEATASELRALGEEFSGLIQWLDQAKAGAAK